MSRLSDPYGVLGLPHGAPIDDVKKAYRKLVLQWHPDKNPHRKEEAEEQFKRISAAYAAICDPPAAQTRDARDIFREFFGGRDPFAAFFGGSAFGSSIFDDDDDDDFFGDFRAQQQQQQARSGGYPMHSRAFFEHQPPRTRMHSSVFEQRRPGMPSMQFSEEQQYSRPAMRSTMFDEFFAHDARGPARAAAAAPGTSRKTETIISGGKKVTRVTVTTTHPDGRRTSEVTETVKEVSSEAYPRGMPTLSETAVRIPIIFKH